MKRGFSAALFLAGALFSSSKYFEAPAHAQTKPKNPVAADRAEARKLVAQLLREGRIIRASSVKRGMRGVARSVFQGTKIEEFPIEVLGTLGKVQGGGDMVLIKVLGGPVVKRNTGIIAGMSGSPVYINGKMLGAIAFGWGFPKEPIGGVTPITDMIGAALPDSSPSSNPAATSKAKIAKMPPQTPLNVRAALQKGLQSTFVPHQPLKINGRDIARVVVSRDKKRFALAETRGETTMNMRPVSTLLQVSGFSEASMPRLRRIFEPYGVEPVLGMSSKKLGVKPQFIPGGAIGVQLVSGDMDQSAVGTLTFRYGKRVLAFGHPMFGQGAESLPITTSYIQEIFPSYQKSFKMASVVDVVGALQQDTQFAIGGTVGAKADMIPMTVSLRQPSRQIVKTFHVRVMKDPILTPDLIGSVAGEAIETTLGQTSDKMVRVGMRMQIDNAKTIVRHNYLYANQAITGAALNDLGQTLALTQQNEFARGSIKRVDLDIVVEDKRMTARIKQMTADRNKVKAGESVGVNVVLESIDKPGQTFTKSFRFAVPADAPSGALKIAAASSANYWGLQTRVGGAPPDPKNLPQLVEAWRQVGSLDELMVVASTPREFLQVEDARVPNPPASFSRLLRGAAMSDVASFNEVETRRVDTDFSLSGSALLSIPVESIKHPDKAAPATVTTGSSAPVALPDAPANPPSPPADAPPADPGPGSGDGDGQSTLDGFQSTLSGANSRATIDRIFAHSVFLEYLSNLKSERRQTLPKRDTPTPAIATTVKAIAPTPTPTPTPTPVPTPTPLPDTKSLARPAQSWVQGGTADFIGGDFNGAQVSSDGRVQIAPPHSTVANTPEPFVWAVAGNERGTYIGLANPARVRRIAPDGTQSTLYEDKNVSVTALTLDKSGNLYAGLTPSGEVWRIAPNGAKTRILKSGQSFVGALEWDENNRLLIGTGGESGKLFRLNAPANVASDTAGAPLALASPIALVPQNHIRAIAARGNDIFIGTGGEGVLYRVDGGSGRAEALYQIGERDAKGTADAEVLAVATAPDGVYFGTSQNGTVYRWTKNEGVIALYPSPQQAVYALRRAPDGKLYAATGDKGIVYAIVPGRNDNDTTGARILEPTPTQALALAIASSGDLLVGTGNSGGVYRVALGDTKRGTFTSSVFDAKNVVRWGAARVVGAGATVETRAGNTLDPDASWSNWQTIETSATGESRVASPSARYLQYRAQFNGAVGANSPAATPNLSRIEVLYRAKNSAPQVMLAGPRGGEFWNGKRKINWAAKDPDADALRYSAWLSSDDGKTWQPLPIEDATADNIDMDTSKWKDGVYRVKVEASDAMRNPDDPQRDTSISLPFTIDNTPPRVDGARFDRKSADGPRLNATSADDLSPIAGAVWRWKTEETKAKPAPTADNKTAEPAKTSDAAKTTNTTKTGDVAKAAQTSTAAAPAKAATPGVTKTADVPKTPDASKPVEVKVDDWHAMAAGDGIFDSRREDVLAIVEETKSGDGKADGANTRGIEIRAQDAAGNTSTITVPAS